MNKNEATNNLALLRSWMASLKYEDFHNPQNDKGIVRYGGCCGSHEPWNQPPKIVKGTVFITDVIGDSLSLVEKNGRNNCRNWESEINQLGTVVMSMRKTFGGCVNGPFALPELDWLKEHFGRKNNGNNNN